jgi:photosystem II stability/assembly factor-like uncharacterized protein
MSIHFDGKETKEDAHLLADEPGLIAQPMRPPTQPPPQPPSRPPRGNRERWFIVSALLVVLVIVLVLGSVFVVQLSNHPATQTTPTPAPTATAKPAPSATAVTPAPTATATIPAPPTTVTTTPTPYSGPYQPINGLWMSNATTGWARTATQLILHTADGGKSWQDVTPPYPIGNILVGPSFTSLNGTIAWVAVSQKQLQDGTVPSLVYYTSDGGHSWHDSSLPSSDLGVSQVQFVNAQDGWVLSSFGGGAAGSQAIDLFRTTDGGLTWSTVARAGSSPNNLPAVGQKTGMGWASATTGWITGSIAAAQNTVYLYRTQDGGVTWHLQSLPLPSIQAIVTTQPPVFFSAADGVLPVSFFNGQGTSFDVYATHDGGATWSRSTLLTATVNAWDFLTMQQGWVVGANGTTLYETSDGGLHWTTITPSANLQHISQLNFVSAQEGWAINTAAPNAPVLLKTLNGGQTWVQVSPNPPATTFKVTSVSMTVNPTSIAGTSCGTSTTVTYTALFHLAPNGPGGTIHFAYTINNGRGTTPASLTVPAGQTTASYSFVWSGNLPPDHTYPGAGGVMVQSPNVISSPMLGPSGTCS